MLVSSRIPPAGLALLGGLWLLHWALSGRLTAATPFGAALFALLALLPLTLTITIDLSLTLPKAQGIVLGAAITYGIVNVVRDRQRIHLSILLLVLIALGVAAIGLVGTEWADDKLFNAHRVYDTLPQLIRYEHSSTSARVGIHANQTGGALSFLVPLLASLLWHRVSFELVRLFKAIRYPGLMRFGITSLLILAFVMTLLTLLLTQSRGALLGAAAGLLGLAIWKDRRFLWAIPVLAGAVWLYALTTTNGNLADFILMVNSQTGSTLPYRLELWWRAIYLVQDFPFTGTGLGTYGALVNLFYPVLSNTIPTSTHPHNQLLTVAVDLGIPALVLYLALLSSFATMAVRSAKTAPPAVRALLVGLTCGMLAHQVFGFMDAIKLGSRMGVLMWVYFGLVATIYIHQGVPQEGAGASSDRQERPTWAQIRPRMRDLLWGVGHWVLFSLVAISFVNIQPIVSLGIAVLLGVLLGFMLTWRYDETTRQLAKKEAAVTTIT